MLSKANPTAKLVYLDNMTHVLKDGEANRMSAQKVYQQIELPLTAGLLKPLLNG